MKLSLGYSPCPNDSFIFYAIKAKKVAKDIAWDIQLHDVEALNQLAKKSYLDISKISYHAFGYFVDDYIMLRSGGALGKGVGPLIVSKDKLSSLKNKLVAIPGELTTANLLLQISQNTPFKTIELRYDKIMPAVARAELDAGLIIHESRFTYSNYGLSQFIDLGEWWERETDLPLPLGGIMAKRSLGDELLTKIDSGLKASIDYAYKHRAEAQPYISKHADEMSEEVMQKHIDLYVNEYSKDVGLLGQAAVKELLARARSKGLTKLTDKPLFHNGA